VHRRQVEPTGHLAVGLLELAVPALELAGDVVLLAAEVAEAHRVDVDGVDCGHDVDERLTRPSALVGIEALGIGLVAHHGAVDEVHHVEGGAVDRLVGAEPDGCGNRHVGAGQSRDDLVLAAHVVGGGEDLAERWAPQHPAAGDGVGDLEGEVGVPTRDEPEVQRR